MISVIIPVYNQAEKIGECLASLLTQTCQDFEVIIVNDGSMDNLRAVLENFQEKQVGRWQVINQTNQGSNPARNRGAQEAKGDYLLFCDADLVMKPLMLQRMKETLEDQPSVSFVYSSFRLGKKLFKLWPYDRERLKQMPYIHTTSLIRTQDFPGFDNNIKRLQDWDLWLTMSEQGKIGYWLDEVLFTVKPGGRISQWLPKITYWLCPWLPAVKKYQQAIAIIKVKYQLK